MRQCTAWIVDHDKAGFLFFDGPRRREAAGWPWPDVCQARLYKQQGRVEDLASLNHRKKRLIGCLIPA
jgi:hypothetical protein